MTEQQVSRWLARPGVRAHIKAIAAALGGLMEETRAAGLHAPLHVLVTGVLNGCQQVDSDVLQAAKAEHVVDLGLVRALRSVQR